MSYYRKLLLWRNDIAKYWQTLTDLIQDLLQCYEKCKSLNVSDVEQWMEISDWHPFLIDQHEVIKVKLSKPIVHNVTSCEPINWKVDLCVTLIVLMLQANLISLFFFFFFFCDSGSVIYYIVYTRLSVGGFHYTAWLLWTWKFVNHRFCCTFFFFFFVTSYSTMVLFLLQMLILNLKEMSADHTRKAMEKFSRTIRSLQ